MHAPAAPTPDLTDLFARLAAPDEDDAKDALRRLARPAAAPQALAEALRLSHAAPPLLLRRLYRLFSRIGAPNGGEGDGAAAQRRLLEGLGDPDPRLRRGAITALGSFPGPEVEDALLNQWAHCELPELRRALAAALGKAGGARALALLQSVRTDDPELRRLIDQAVVLLQREAARDTPATLRLEILPAAPLPVALRCREGLEELLCSRLGRALQGQVRGPGLVEATLRDAPQSLLRSRLLLRFGFVLTAPPAEDLGQALAELLTGDAAQAIFGRFTHGPARFRLDFSGGGHRRAVVWRCAQLVAARDLPIRNDPTRSLWEAEVSAGPAGIRVELCPRLRDDPRFAYRQGDVQGASHPTLAAALAAVGGAQPDDVVWDPFVGSGLELAERLILGPYAFLHGTDTAPEALRVAERNLRAAGVDMRKLRLAEADARRYDPGTWPGPPTLILTNPPMGRRVLAGRDLRPLLGPFLQRAHDLLKPGGRLVWYSPMPRFTAAQARAVGLRETLRQSVDMGGFHAEMQAFEKPRAPGPRA